MTTLPPILRDSALPLPFVVLPALVLGDLQLAIGTLLAGVLSVLNLALLGLLIDRVARSTASGAPSGVAGFLLSGKLVASLAVFGWLLLVFPPLSVPLGLGAVIGGLCVHPMLQHVWPGPVVGLQES